MTPYEVLGVASDASVAEIKAAYRDAVKAHHPDAGGDPTAFIQAQRAYAVLSDPDRRARYDRTGVEEDVSPAEEQEAYAVVAALVLQVVDGNEDLRRTDVIAKVRDALDRIAKDHLAARDGVDARLARIQLMRSRLRRDGPGEDVLAALLAEREARLESARSSELDRLRIVDRALRILTVYSYCLDPTAPEEAAIWSALKTGA